MAAPDDRPQPLLIVAPGEVPERGCGKAAGHNHVLPGKLPGGPARPCRGHLPLGVPIPSVPSRTHLSRDSRRPPYREPTPRKRRTPREAPCIGAGVDGVTTEGEREPFGTRRRAGIRWSTKEIGTAWQARFRCRPVEAAPWVQLGRFRRPAPDGPPTPAGQPGCPEPAWRDIDPPRFTPNLVPMPSLPRDDDPRDLPWRRLRGRDRWKNPSP